MSIGLKKFVLFGGGKMGLCVYRRLSDKIIAVIDNDPSKWGKKFIDNIPIISLQEYEKTYDKFQIMIASSKYAKDMAEQLETQGIYNYSFAVELYRRKDVPFDQDIAHRCWPDYLKRLCDKKGADILELGSRRVNQMDKWNEYFENANYTGFDYYPGENVDITGDAHKLSQYFDKKFDLIFSSAVFEHLAMPWQVALEIIKLLKPGGYVFIETHYCHNSHERPWHFFQFSEEALNVLFPEKFGMKCIKKGCSNLLEGKFSEDASEYLQGKMVGGLYCHSEFLAQKTKDIPDNELTWDNVLLEDVTGNTRYPQK